VYAPIWSAIHLLSLKSSLGFPAASAKLETFGFKFSSGASHVSRTIMLQELGAILTGVSLGSSAQTMG
jgi:hypothetical protein